MDKVSDKEWHGMRQAFGLESGQRHDTWVVKWLPFPHLTGGVKCVAGHTSGESLCSLATDKASDQEMLENLDASKLMSANGFYQSLSLSLSCSRALSLFLSSCARQRARSSIFSRQVPISYEISQEMYCLKVPLSVLVESTDSKSAGPAGSVPI